MNQEIERLKTKCDYQAHRIAQLEKVVSRQQFIEDRYEELKLSARRCWRFYGADQELFAASMKAMDFLIRRHTTEIEEMDDERDNEASNAALMGDSGLISGVPQAPTFDEWWDKKPSECLIVRDTARWIWQMVHNAALTRRP